MLTKGKRLLVLNILGTLGYTVCLLQWLWVVIAFLPGIINSDIFKALTVEKTAEPPQPTSAGMVVSNDFSGILAYVAGLIALGVIVVTIIALKRLPKTLGESGKTLTHSTAEKIVPVITHHKKLPVQKRRKLTARIVFDIKLTLLTLPLIVALFAPDPAATIAHELFVFISAMLALTTLLLFCIQVGLARMLRTELAELW